jgi:hypothetical protein
VSHFTPAERFHSKQMDHQSVCTSRHDQTPCERPLTTTRLLQNGDGTYTSLVRAASDQWLAPPEGPPRVLVPPGWTTRESWSPALSVYREVERQIAVGDRVQFTAPNRTLGVAKSGSWRR